MTQNQLIGNHNSFHEIYKDYRFFLFFLFLFFLFLFFLRIVKFNVCVCKEEFLKT